MTVILLDSFERTSPPNLATNPANRWRVDSPGGALVNDWSLDGQVCKSAETMTASTIVWAAQKSPTIGSRFGESRIRLRRTGTVNITSIGIIARSSTVTLNRERMVFRVDGTTWKLEVWSAYALVGTTIATLAVGSPTPNDALWHDWAIRITAGSGNLINILCKFDGNIIFNIINATDLLTALGSSYTQPGFQATTGSGFVAVSPPLPAFPIVPDEIFADNMEFDDLTTATQEVAPALVADPVLSTVGGLADEGASVGTLPFNPDLGEIVEYEDPIVEVPTEAGYDVVYYNGARPRLFLRLTHKAMNATDAATMVTFLTSATGSLTGFEIDDFTGVTRRVIYVENSFEFTQLNSGVFGQATYTVMEIVT